MPYWSIAPGASWTYRNNPTSDPRIERATYTVRQVNADGFTMQANFGDADLLVDYDYRCTDEGIVGFGALLSALSQFNARTELLEANGVLVPRDLRVGQSWGATLRLRQDIQIGDTSVNAISDITLSHRAVGEEVVAVPAGEFRAIRAEGTLKMSTQAEVRGMSVPVDFEFGITQWYAPRVGWVKAENVAPTGERIITELVEYSLP